MKKLSDNKLDFKKLDRIVDDLVNNPKNGILFLEKIPETIFVYSYSEPEREYVAKGLAGKFGNVVSSRRDKGESVGHYKIDLDYFLG